VSHYEAHLESAPVLPDDFQVEYSRLPINDSQGQAAEICAPPSQAPQVSLNDPLIATCLGLFGSSRVHSAQISCYKPHQESAPVLHDELQVESAQVPINDSQGQAVKICAPPSQAAQLYLSDPRLQPV